jgi:hypothetical protein
MTDGDHKAFVVVAPSAGTGESKNARKMKRKRKRKRKKKSEERPGLEPSPSSPPPLGAQSDEGRTTPASTEVDGSAKKRRRRKKRMEMAMARRRLDEDLLQHQGGGGREESRDDAGGEMMMPSFPTKNDEYDDDVSGRREEKKEKDEWEGKVRASKSSLLLRAKSTTKSGIWERRVGNFNDVDGEGGGVSNDDGKDDDDDDGGGWSPIAEVDSEGACGDEKDGDPLSKSSGKRRRRLHGNEWAAEGGGTSARPGTASREQKMRRCGNEQDDDDSAENHLNEDNNDRGVSIEALKRDILGRSIASMYDSPPDRDLSRSAYESAIRRALMPIVAADSDPSLSAIARRLRHELSCPICHDRLYDPASLLCGHSFCHACLDWWLEARHRTCPSCRDPIPVSSDGTSNDDSPHKPSIRINTVLKTVLCVLYPEEMNLRRLTELQLRRRAVGGEANGRHSHGRGVEIEPLPEEGDDELCFLREESVTDEDAAVDRDRDEGNGWKPLYASLNGPGRSSLPSNRRQQEEEGMNIYGSDACVLIRRNIVLDEIDQRYRLSFGFTKCTYYPGGANKTIGVAMMQSSATATSASVAEGVFDIELCLLSMEEDEVDESGFPTVIKHKDDNEVLICAGSDHRVHTCIESSMRVATHSLTASFPYENIDGCSDVVFGSAKKGLSSALVREISLSRGMIGRDGTVRFRIDINAALKDAMTTMMKNDQDEEEKDEDSAILIHCDYGSGLQVVKLIFRHVDTGAVLELRLPSRSDMDGIMQKCSSGEKIEFCGVNKPGVGHALKDENDPSRYFLDDDDDEDDDDEPNEYEEDGFLVHGSQDSENDDEGEFDSVGELNDDDDVCKICKNGGELIVCDGGDHRGGCGHMYHVHCIGRSGIPPGTEFSSHFTAPDFSLTSLFSNPPQGTGFVLFVPMVLEWMLALKAMNMGRFVQLRR